MPENLISESKIIIEKILTGIYVPTNDVAFDELIQKCNKIPYCRDELLDSANEKITKLLNKN